MLIHTDGSNVLKFALGSALPATVNADMKIVITLADGTVATKWRRFMRAPPAPPGVMPTQVDHYRKGLLVAGQPFMGVGFYISLVPPRCVYYIHSYHPYSNPY